MRAYFAYLRERVFADCDVGLPTADVASKYRVSPGWVRRMRQRRRSRGETAAREQRYGPQPKWAEHLKASLEEHRRRLGLGLRISML